MTCILLHLKHERELAERAQIDQLIAEVEMEEHQVAMVAAAEPEPTYVYEPKSDEYYEELELLAHILHAENSNEIDGEEACWNTGAVILNRIYDPEYPDNLYDVLYQRGQYECTWNGTLYREEPTDIEWEVAASLLELLEKGENIIPEDIVYAAEFTQGSGVYDKIGRTYYCHK